MKRIYEDNRPNDREFIEGIPFEDLKKHFVDLANILRSNYRLETDEQLHEFNKHLITEEEAQEVIENEIPEEKEVNEDEPKKKRCGGQWHKTEEERMVPLEMFYRHSSHKDGRARLCKDCYAKSQNRQGYNEKCRRDKPLPEFDPATHKWCNRCESVKEHAQYYSCSSTKDGLCSNCKACKTEQKKKKQQVKENKNQ